MGRRGPKPKPRSEVRQPNRIAAPEVLPASTVERAPRLPRSYETEPGTDGQLVKVVFTKATREWWREMSRSPVAARFIGTDWVRLELLARLVDSYVRKPSHTVLAEIRLNEGLIGGTVGDRERLGIRVMLPSTPAPAPVHADQSGKVSQMARYRRTMGGDTGNE